MLFISVIIHCILFKTTKGEKINKDDVCIKNYSSTNNKYIENILIIEEKISNSGLNMTNEQIDNLTSLLNDTYSKLLDSKIDTSIEVPKNIRIMPYMSEKETIAFTSFMNPSYTYFEFGSGGSTLLAEHFKLKIYSVESNAKWYRKLKSNKLNATLILIDLKARRHGYPGKSLGVADWIYYIESYKPDYNADVILIDGRFRVACALNIFNKIRNDTVVLVHDYERKRYHIIEKYFILVRRWERLAAFFKRLNISSIDQNDYFEYINKLS